MTEQWRPVVGYEGLYEVSDQGRVRSLDRAVARGRGEWTQPGRVLSPAVRRCGHLHVILCRDSIKDSRLVHHLVLEAFVGPRPPGLEGCHGNGDPADNSVANLRWDTRSANVFDSVRHGTHNHASRTHCSKGHELTPDNVYKDPARNRRQCKQCARNRARSNRQEKISA